MNHRRFAESRSASALSSELGLSSQSSFFLFVQVSYMLASPSRCAPLRSGVPTRRTQRARGTPGVVCMALTKERKAEQVDKLKSALEQSTLVLSFDHSDVSVKNMMEFRRAMKDDTEVMVVKNTLVRRAASETEGWDGLGEVATGTNTWIFVGSDFKSAIKPFKELQKDLKARDIERDFNAGLLEGQKLSPQQLKTVEDLPSKADLIATIARLINQPASKLAFAVKAVPGKVGYAAEALRKKADETQAGTLADLQ